MLTIDFFFHYLLSKKSGSLIKIISWLCLIGVMAGVSSLIVVMSIMNGFNRSVKNKLLASKAHIIVQADSANQLEAVKNLKLPALESSHRIDSQDVVIRTMEGNYGGGVAKGVDIDYLFKLQNRLRKHDIGKEGSFTFSENEFNLNENEVVVGSNLATHLKIYEGDTVLIIPPEALLLPSGELPYYSKATVKSILQTELQDLDSQVLFYIRGQGLQSLNSSRGLNHEIEIRLMDLDELEVAQTEIKKLGLKVTNWEERDRSMLFALKMEKFIIATFIGLSTLITGFSIITVLLILITQKRRDIGILMSMGLSKDSCRNIFVRIGMLLSGLGVLFGLSLGILICVIIDKAKLNILPNIYYDTSVPVFIEYSLIFYVAVVALILSFIGAYVPTRLTLKYTPAEALRAKTF